MKFKQIVRTLINLSAYRYLDRCIEGINKGWFPIFIKYPVIPVPRYGYDKPPHRLLYKVINENRVSYRLILESFRYYTDDLLKIQHSCAENSIDPCWNNPWFSGLDAIALYSLIASNKPKLYIEIGSGNSTKFARRAITNHLTNTKIISIDPNPRVEIDGISDKVIREALEETDLSVFDELSQNDIVFFDGSHRCFMNSDVTVFFLEVLPKLPAGVLIHLHDIHFPYDYPPERAMHYESEQYLVAVMLLTGCTEFELWLPNKFVVNEKELIDILDCLWDAPEVKIPQKGTSLWLKRVAKAQ